MNNRFYYLCAAFRNGWKLPLFALARCNARLLSAIPSRPIYAGLNLTHRCNSRCITCNSWKMRPSEELDLGEVSHLLYDLKKVGVQVVNLGGGEPLLRKDLSLIVARAKQLGIAPNLTTNGILLNQQIAEDLLQGGLNAIVISIDGIGQTNDSVRGVNGLFERNLMNLGMLTKLRDSMYPSFQIEIGTTLMKPTVSDIKPLVLMCADLKISMSLNLIDASPILFQGIETKDLWITDMKELDSLVADLHSLRARYPTAFATRQTAQSFEYMKHYFKDPRQEQLPCTLGYSVIDFDPFGNVYPGCWVLGPVGNIRSRPLSEILSSEEYRERIVQMFKKQCPGCACGYQTNLLFNLESLLKEIRWKLLSPRRRMCQRT